MRLNSKNYYSSKANWEYLSVSQYKDFCGSLGEAGCEAKAMAKLKGEWQDEITTAMLIGSYVDAWFEGTLNQFAENTPELFNKNGTLKADFIKANEIIERVKKDPLFMKYMSGKKQKIMSVDNRERGFCCITVEFGKFPVKYTASHRENGVNQSCIHITFHSHFLLTYIHVS